MDLGTALVILFLGIVAITVLVLRRNSPRDDSATPPDAQRLATLLVIELKLYNVEALEQAKQQGRISDELREDIERSRNMYDERIPPSERGDHFQQALISILADGDPTLISSQ